jgi:hypothetical protein
VATGVQLEQHPFPGIAVTASALFGGSSTARRGNPRLKQHPPHGGAGKPDPLVFGQHLGQVLVIEALVLVSGQLNDTRSRGSIDGVVGEAATVAVRQAGRSFSV